MNSNIIMCLLSLLWSYEIVYIGRLKVDHPPYEEKLYGNGGDNASTMNTLWCSRVVRSFSNTIEYTMYICHDYFISYLLT
jgi:hypothetical protein